MTIERIHLLTRRTGQQAHPYAILSLPILLRSLFHNHRSLLCIHHERHPQSHQNGNNPYAYSHIGAKVVHFTEKKEKLPIQTPIHYNIYTRARGEDIGRDHKQERVLKHLNTLNLHIKSFIERKVIPLQR